MSDNVLKKSARKAIIAYCLLSFLLLFVPLMSIWQIPNIFGMVVYSICLLFYINIAVTFAARVTIMPSLWKELDPEKYSAIISTRPFTPHYSYRLNLYFAVGDYQTAYNVISSALLQHKKVQRRILGHLLICRICFKRGEYEGIKDNLDQINDILNNNTNAKIPRQCEKAYGFYHAFSNADYESVCALLETSTEKNSKSDTYFSLVSQYQLAVTKRMKGDADEAVALFESIKEKAPKLHLSTLAENQLDYISGTLEEIPPEKIEVTETDPLKSDRKAKNIRLVVYITVGTVILLAIVGNMLSRLNVPKFEYKDFELESKIESTLNDDYEDYQILGYFNIYTDYADKTHSMNIDSLFLVEADGSLDLHTLYKLNGEYKNNLNVKDIRVDQPYEYEIIFVSQKVEFVLTEKERNIPDNSLYYYELDGYYFCVMSISDL